MSEQSFTPGERWSLVETETSIDLDGVVNWQDIADANGRVVAAALGYGHPESALDARARLIAAAPALLEALKALIPTNVGNPAASIPEDQVLPVDMTVGELRKALAAISQAEGRDHG